jgi:hypothetical protein
MQPKFNRLILLSTSTAKTKKSWDFSKEEWVSAHHFLYPEVNFKKLCPFSTAECRACCLVNSGKGSMSTVIAARQRRTEQFLTKQKEYVKDLSEEIGWLHRWCKANGKKLCVRLNATSDILWERIAPELFEHKVQFYDYTKVPGRNNRQRPRNYHITFSYSGKNVAQCDEELCMGGNVSVVFNVKKGHDLPKQWSGWRVVDGDIHDLRWKDEPSTVIGLRYKHDTRAEGVRGTKEDAPHFVVSV